MGNIERWTITVCDGCGQQVGITGHAGRCDPAEESYVEVVSLDQLKGAVEAEREWLRLILKADQGDIDRTIPLLAAMARNRLAELGAVAMAKGSRHDAEALDALPPDDNVYDPPYIERGQ